MAGTKGNRSSQIAESIDALKKYYGVKSKADFFLMALTGENQTTGEEETPPGSEVAARNIAEQLNNQDGALLVKDWLASLEDTIAGDDGDVLREQLRASFLVVGGVKNDVGVDQFKDYDPAGLMHDSITFKSMLPQSYSSVNQEDNPDKSAPSIALIQVRPSVLNVSSRDTGAVDLFMNSIPPLEWSRAIPHFSLMIVNEGKKPFLDGDPGISAPDGALQSFLMGPDFSFQNTQKADWAMAQAEYEFIPQQFYSGKDSQELIAGESSTLAIDISSFISPQTLVNADRSYSSFDSVGTMKDGSEAPTIPVKDKMRPFLTVKDLSISVKGTKYGAACTKGAKLNITLHDRSRLHEIGNLVRPGTFGSTEILLEYGWSHPSALNKSSASNEYSEYGKFLNALKVKEKYRVRNTSYNFTEDGQVDISLDLVSSGYDNFNLNDIALDPSVQATWAALEEIIQTVRMLTRKLMPGKEFQDVAGVSQVTSLSLTNAHSIFKGDNLKEIRRFKRSLTSKKQAPKAAKDLEAALTKAQSAYESHGQALGSILSAKMGELNDGNDPFLMPRIRVRSDGVKASEKVKKIMIKEDLDVTFPLTPNPDLRSQIREKRRVTIRHPTEMGKHPEQTDAAYAAEAQADQLEKEMAAGPSQDIGAAHIAAMNLYEDMFQLVNGIYYKDYDPGANDTVSMSDYVYWKIWDKLTEAEKTKVGWHKKKVKAHHYDYYRKNMQGNASALQAGLNQFQNADILDWHQRNLIKNLGYFTQAPTRANLADKSTAEILREAERLKSKAAEMLEFQADFQRNLNKAGQSDQKDIEDRRDPFKAYQIPRVNNSMKQSFSIDGVTFDWQAWGPGADSTLTAIDRYLVAQSSNRNKTGVTAQGVVWNGSDSTYSLPDGTSASVAGNPYSGIGITGGGFLQIYSAVADHSDPKQKKAMRDQLEDLKKAAGKRQYRSKRIPVWGKYRYASLGKIFASFVALPLASSGRYDEVQVYFYCFNDKASWMWTQNISSMPIKIRDFKKRMEHWREKRGNVSINSFLQFLSKAFTSSMDNPAYGFGKFYEWDEENLTVKTKEKVNVAAMNLQRETTLRDAYSNGADTLQPLTFKKPSLQVYVEVVPVRTRGGSDGVDSGTYSTVCRIHVFDANATKYTGANALLQLANNSNMGVMQSGLMPIVKIDDDDLGGADQIDACEHATIYNFYIKKALEDFTVLGKKTIKYAIPEDDPRFKKGATESDPQDVFYIKGGPEALKYFIKSMMPSITIESSTSAVISVGAASKHNGAMATIQMMRYNKSPAKGESSMPGVEDVSLPMRMSPMSVTMEVMGCPIINYGQQFFIDFGTGTTIDNIYAVTSIEHKMSQGEYKTSIGFHMIDSYGKYESLLTIMNKAALNVNIMNPSS